METSAYNFSKAQKESCAVSLMIDAVDSLSRRENIPYEDALLLFASSKVYDALFDIETGIWKEGPTYILSLYDYCKAKEKLT